MSAPLEIVEVLKPGRGNNIAEQVASLVTREVIGNPTPTADDLYDTLDKDIDPSYTLAALDHQSVVLGTGGMRLYRTFEDVLVAGIVNVAVHEAARGRRVGSYIIEALEEKSWRLGAREIFTLPISSGAAAFYEALGYRPARRPYMPETVHFKRPRR